ncbi:hypothetical protein AAH978_15535 [Streptomyces sp. ZYX-F-203]
MPAAAVEPEPQPSPAPESRPAAPVHPPSAPVRKRPLPPGRPRAWYIAHNRRLKAMRLAIALLDSGVHRPIQASDDTIRGAARTIGLHPPSDTTCRMVRALMRYSR